MGLRSGVRAGPSNKSTPLSNKPTFGYPRCVYWNVALFSVCFRFPRKHVIFENLTVLQRVYTDIQEDDWSNSIERKARPDHD